MKPPSRRRAKPARLEVEEEDSAQDCPGEVPLAPWSRIEQHGALVVLRRLDPSAGDIDYDALKKRLPRRSISQIRSMVEALKDKVIKSASSQLISQRNAEKRFQKPIELWTEMALIMAGTLEKPISAAFSQMLMVSSTEPCSLRNSDPPHSHTPATDQQTPGLRFVPMRPMPSRPAPGLHPKLTNYKSASISESAIVLDLLMSLPEELPKLDCNNLQRHMIQVRLPLDMTEWVFSPLPPRYTVASQLLQTPRRREECLTSGRKRDKTTQIRVTGRRHITETRVKQREEVAQTPTRTRTEWIPPVRTVTVMLPWTVLPGREFSHVTDKLRAGRLRAVMHFCNLGTWKWGDPAPSTLLWCLLNC
uniref:Uncharacterized protein n=1 Tax=Myripristis murdjan TaxID=586833 RepID=A0A667XRS2_9TELE